MASEQYSGGMQAEEENTKPSFMNKVKSKAKKLKSKLKPHDSEDSSGQAPAPRDPLDHYTTGSANQDGNESDTSSSSDEAGNGNQHASEGTPFGGVSSGKSGYGIDSKNDDKSFPVDPAVLKSGGPPGTQEAIPTNYSYFNADPEQARFPSDNDAPGRQRSVPSTMGGLSAGLTPAMQNSSAETPSPFAKHDIVSRSGDRDSELPLSSTSSEDSAVRNNLGLVEPSQPSQDSLLSHPIEQDQGVNDKDNEGYGGLAAAAATAAGAGGVAAGMGHEFQKSVSNESPMNVSSGTRSTPDPEAFDRSFTESGGEGFAPHTTGTAGGAKHSMDTNFNAPSQEPTWTQKIYNTVEGAKDIVASHPVTQSVVSHPVTQNATESAYGLKDTVASKLGYADQAMSSDSTPVSEKVTDSAVEAKDSTASNLSANDEQKPFMDRMTESSYGMKDAVLSHPITQTGASKLGYADQAMSTDSTPVSQKATDSASSNLSANDGAQKPFTNRLSESAYGLKDTVASHPVTQKAYDLKDTVVSHPVTQKTADYAVQGKNYAANQLSYADQALSSDNKPVSAKTYEAAFQARDAAVQKTTPDHHDKALADSVTESISSLPALLTSKLGLGGGTTASSPTTASTTPTADATTFDPSTRKDTPFPDHPAAAPGIMDRVSGLASSLFGGGAKHPATPTDSERPASDEKYIP